MNVEDSVEGDQWSLIAGMLRVVTAPYWRQCTSKCTLEVRLKD